MDFVDFVVAPEPKVEAATPGPRREYVGATIVEPSEQSAPVSALLVSIDMHDARLPAELLTVIMNVCRSKRRAGSAPEDVR